MCRLLQTESLLENDSVVTSAATPDFVLSLAVILPKLLFLDTSSLAHVLV